MDCSVWGRATLSVHGGPALVRGGGASGALMELWAASCSVELGGSATVDPVWIGPLPLVDFRERGYLLRSAGSWPQAKCAGYPRLTKSSNSHHKPLTNKKNAHRCAKQLSAGRRGA